VNTGEGQGRAAWTSAADRKASGCRGRSRGGDVVSGGAEEGGLARRVGSVAFEAVGGFAFASAAGDMRVGLVSDVAFAGVLRRAGVGGRGIGMLEAGGQSAWACRL
jgi:hypothetical protein